MSMMYPLPAPARRPEEGWLYQWFYDHGIRPNHISLVRLGFVPIVILLIGLSTSVWIAILAAVVFLIAALTDRWDGELARRSGQISESGKFLDTLIDKSLIIGTLAAIAYFHYPGDFRWWLAVGLVAVPEIISVLLRSWIKWHRPTVDLAAQWWGKVKMVAQIVLVASLIVINPSDIGVFILWTTVVTTVVADIATISRLIQEYRKS